MGRPPVSGCGRRAPLEDFLAGVVILPGAEVAEVAVGAQLGRPGFLVSNTASSTRTGNSTTPPCCRSSSNALVTSSSTTRCF